MVLVIWIQTTFDSSTGSIVKALIVVFTTANTQQLGVQNSNSNSTCYNPMRNILYVCRFEYDDHKLYDLSRDVGFLLVCPE